MNKIIKFLLAFSGFYDRIYTVTVSVAKKQNSLGLRVACQSALAVTNT